MEALKKMVAQILPLQKNVWSEILPFLNKVDICKDDFICKENEYCDFLAFIETGSFRAFYTDYKSEETNLLLCSSQESITDYESFIRGTPAKLSIQALEDAQIIMLRKNDIDQLFEKSFYWNKFGRLLAEIIYLRSKRRTEELLFMSPEERYLNLLESSPEFFQKYPLKHISSYLGVTPQSLSRIRARLAQK